MNTTTCVLCAAAFAISGGLSGQQLVGSAGGDLSGTTTSLSFSIGEPVTATADGGIAALTQGFQQPWADVSTVVGAGPLPAADIEVYPNPARHLVYISVPGAAVGDMYRLFDTDGRLVSGDKLDGSLTELDITPWAAGAYFLRLSDAHQQPLGTFRINVTR